MTWALVAVVVAMLVERLWSQRTIAGRERLLVEALVARHAPDLALMERSGLKPRRPSPPPRVTTPDGEEVDPRDQIIVGLNGN